MSAYILRMRHSVLGGSSSYSLWRRGLLGLFLTLFLFPMLAYSTPAATDVELRVALLFNFMRFTEWPNGALGAAGAPVTICIARGDGEMQQALRVLEQRTLRERPVVIQPLATHREVTACHVVYLPGALPGGRFSDFVDAASGGGILTVSDRAGFIDDSGMIGLKLVDNRYQFEVNNSAVRRAELRLHPQLLSLASRVR